MAGLQNRDADGYDRLVKTAQPESHRTILPLCLEYPSRICQQAARLTREVHFERRVTIARKLNRFDQFSQFADRSRIITAQPDPCQHVSRCDLRHGEIELQQDGFFHPASKLRANPRAEFVQEPADRGLTRGELCRHRFSRSVALCTPGALSKFCPCARATQASSPPLVHPTFLKSRWSCRGNASMDRHQVMALAAYVQTRAVRRLVACSSENMPILVYHPDLAENYSP